MTSTRPAVRPLDYRPDGKGPLDGLRVLDLSRLVSGNMVSLQLADFGAEVIKIESPKRGDDLRHWRTKGVPTYWKVYGRNKKSAAIDLKSAEGRGIFLQSAERSHIVIENFRPGTLEKMQLSPKILLGRNRKLNIVRLSGWGQDGPFRHKPGFGSLVEAMSGFASMNGFSDRPPVLPPLALADMVAGLYGAMASLIALRTIEVGGGEGQVVDLSLFEPIFSILGPQAANYQLTGEVEERMGSRSTIAAPRNVYATKDGGWVALSASMQGMAERLFEVIGRPELKSDPKFRTNADRIANGGELDKLIGEWIGARTLEENIAIFDRTSVTVAPVADISQLIKHPYVTERGVLVSLPDKDVGEIYMHDVVPRLSETPGLIRRPAPRLGEHTSELLDDLGFTNAQKQALRESGTIDD